MLDRPDAAEDLARQALQLLSDMEAVPELALAHRELALSLVDKYPEDARKHFLNAIELCVRCGEELHAADTQRLLGDLLIKEQSARAWGEYRSGLMLIAGSLDRSDDVGDVQAEVDRLNEGSLWKQRIMMLLMTAKADGTMQEFIDEQVRMRLEELCRTEDRYIEVSEALSEAGLTTRDGKVLYTKDGNERPFEELIRAGVGEQAKGGMARVVVIDDSKPVREALTRSLHRQRDIEVVGEAASGEAGIQVVDAVGADVVIVDAAMPGIDGAETIKRLLSLRPDLHVVGYSGDPSNEAAPP